MSFVLQGSGWGPQLYLSLKKGVTQRPGPCNRRVVVFWRPRPWTHLLVQCRAIWRQDLQTLDNRSPAYLPSHPIPNPLPPSQQIFPPRSQHRGEGRERRGKDG